VIVIADTSPLNYAVRIGIADALFDLYGQIVVPAAVHAELISPGAPDALRFWVEEHRGSIDVREVSLPDDPGLNSLHHGEAQAIFLAEQTPNSLLIIDEREGRAEARRRGIAITGLLGIIRDAALRGHIDFEDALKKLKETDFRLSDEIEAIVREQYRNSRAEE
jgi:predicted nucleic acid-binding protein